jgi:hypothetical protein
VSLQRLALTPVILAQSQGLASKELLGDFASQLLYTGQQQLSATQVLHNILEVPSSFAS